LFAMIFAGIVWEIAAKRKANKKYKIENEEDK